VRLEAAIDEGPLKEYVQAKPDEPYASDHISTPIWTAFITHHVTSNRWVKESRRPTCVYLSELKRHVFSSQYTPPDGPAALILDFDKERGKITRAPYLLPGPADMDRRPRLRDGHPGDRPGFPQRYSGFLIQKEEVTTTAFADPRHQTSFSIRPTMPSSSISVQRD
jgi:hypothetical protein